MQWLSGSRQQTLITHNIYTLVNSIIMLLHNKAWMTIALISCIVIGTAAIQQPSNPYRNLQVLPRDISEQRLDSIMDTYNRALKVGCDFCHSKATDLTGLSTSNDLDFAKDNGMKDNARRMMRLTIDINKTNFNYDTIKKPDYLLNVITCNTCHRGNPFPSHE